jgi:hypothetical protein
MDRQYYPPLALIGSLIGGVSTFAASWLNTGSLINCFYRRRLSEKLYAEFIIEASKRLTEAWGKQAEGPDVLAGFAAMERIRLVSSGPVLRRRTGDPKVTAYADLDKTFDDMKALEGSGTTGMIHGRFY